MFVTCFFIFKLLHALSTTTTTTTTTTITTNMTVTLTTSVCLRLQREAWLTTHKIKLRHKEGVCIYRGTQSGEGQSKAAGGNDAAR